MVITVFCVCVCVCVCVFFVYVVCNQINVCFVRVLDCKIKLFYSILFCIIYTYTYIEFRLVNRIAIFFERVVVSQLHLFIFFGITQCLV